MPGRLGTHLPGFTLAAAFVALLVFAAMPMDSPAQLTASTVLIGVLWYCRAAMSNEPGNFLRLLALTLVTLISLRYIAWRGFFTLNAPDGLSLTFSLILFIAEIYSISVQILGSIVNSTPVDRPVVTLSNSVVPPEQLPTVDVLIPSYNEDPSLLEVTLRAALNLHYPADKLRIHLLDDGGTDQKIGDPDRKSSDAARTRRRVLQAMCRRLGTNYITRERNERAKAGNVNNGLLRTDGELIVILDADHIPTVDFLDRTVPWLVQHPDVFLVQTPHFMINPDPIDRNLLQSFRRMPSENDMFYQSIQKGLDFWAASFFCGSAAILRRKHVMEVGGLSGDTITEDAETALALHSRGYKSVYVDQPMVAGLAPETFTGFVIQRMRWAQGMTQILMLKRPFMLRGLKWYQRIGYMSSLLFWLFPFARMIFLIAPLAYLVFGIEVYNASAMQIFGYALPHIIASYIGSNILFGRTRWPLISEIYEIMQCVFSMKAIIQVIINPHQPSFVVTPKGDTLEDEFISPLSRPFYVLFFLVFLGFIGGAYRFAAYPLTRDLTTIVLAWNLFNFFTILAALGALVERRQRRSSPRMPAQMKGLMVLSETRSVECEIDDLSAGGARLLLAPAPSRLLAGEGIRLKAYSHALGRDVDLPCQVRSIYALGKHMAVGISFDLGTEELARDAVALAFGDSARWRFFLDRRFRPIPFTAALGMMVRLVGAPVKDHARMLIRKLKKPNPVLSKGPSPHG